MAAYGEDSSRSALTFMPPVTREMVSRPLESPRLAFEPFHTAFCMCFCSSFGCVSDVREIGDMDEGIVEGGEDACDAEDELAFADLRSKLYRY